MTHAVTFAHAIGDQVTVDALDLPARVIALMVDHTGLAYRIAFWSGGQRRTEWVFDWELR